MVTDWTILERGVVLTPTRFTTFESPRPRSPRRPPRTRRERKARNAALSRQADRAGVSVQDLLRAREAAAALTRRTYTQVAFSAAGTVAGRVSCSGSNLTELARES